VSISCLAFGESLDTYLRSDWNLALFASSDWTMRAYAFMVIVVVILCALPTGSESRCARALIALGTRQIRCASRPTLTW
jgi:hypothetical protein